MGIIILWDYSSHEPVAYDIANGIIFSCGPYYYFLS